MEEFHASSMQVLTLAVMVVAVSAAFAHALELPGKMRLTKDEYFAVQSIYYPGFTIAGATEPLATILLLILIVLTPHDAWLLQVALLAWIAMQVVYWLVTHRLNRVWLRRTELSAAGSRFFSLGQRGGASEAAADDWTRLRDRWEHSHVVRAILAGVSFIAVAIAMSFG